jgi:hypothetical protein
VHGRVLVWQPDRVRAARPGDRRGRAGGTGTAPWHPGPATGRFPLALTLKWTDRFDAARDLLRSLYSEHGEHGDEGSLAPVLFHLGELECWAGNWEIATGLADEGHELESRTGQAIADMRALTLDAMVEACREMWRLLARKGRPVWLFPSRLMTLPP